MHRLNAIKRNSFSFRYCIINIYCRPRVYDEEIKDKLNVADTISFSLLMFLFNINLTGHCICSNVCVGDKNRCVDFSFYHYFVHFQFQF